MSPERRPGHGVWQQRLWTMWHSHLTTWKLLCRNSDVSVRSSLSSGFCWRWDCLFRPVRLRSLALESTWLWFDFGASQTHCTSIASSFPKSSFGLAHWAVVDIQLSWSSSCHNCGSAGSSKDSRCVGSCWNTCQVSELDGLLCPFHCMGCHEARYTDWYSRNRLMSDLLVCWRSRHCLLIFKGLLSFYVRYLNSFHLPPDLKSWDQEASWQ